MERGSSDLVREIALERYILPAVSSGKRQFSIAVKDLMKDLKPEGFPSGNWSQICSSIREKKFVKENGLRITGWDGPPSGQSSTVVVHYETLSGATFLPARIASAGMGANAPTIEQNRATSSQQLMEGLRGLLKTELAEYGGCEAFLRWIRSEEKESSPSGSAQ